LKTYHLHEEQTVSRPLPEIFAFFEKPENLAKITPPELGFNILTPTPIEMRAGTQIDYTIKVAGIRMHWTTLISEYDPPHKFVDEQLRGPYRLWHHTHTFRAIPEGTLLLDDIEYALPFGPLGRLAHVLKVKHDLAKIFTYRSQVVSQIFE